MMRAVRFVVREVYQMSRRVLIGVSFALAVAAPVSAQSPEPIAVHELCIAVTSSGEPATVEALRAGLLDGTITVIATRDCAKLGVSPSQTAAPTATPLNSLHGNALALDELASPGTLGLTVKEFRTRWNEANEDDKLSKVPKVETNDNGVQFFTADKGGVEVLGIVHDGKISAAGLLWYPPDSDSVDGSLRALQQILIVGEFAGIMDPDLDEASDNALLGDLDYPIDEEWGVRESTVTRDGVTYWLISYPDDDGDTIVWLIARPAEA